MLARIFLILGLFGALTLPAGAQPAGAGKADALYPVPRFRQVDQDAKPPKLDAGRRLTLIADENFPPFSYADASGLPRGLAVDLALTLCARLSLSCTIRLLRWEELARTLAKGEGDVAISGLRLDDATLSSFDPTRPIYRALGRFAVGLKNPIAQPDIRLLAGKRVGVAKDSAHEAWLKHYFPQSQIISHDTLGEAQEALRSAEIDALFGDSLGLVYWTEGEASQECCRLVAGAFIDEDYFSRGFAFFVRRGDMALREVLDYGLDQLQVSGDWDKVFRAYVPASPW